MAGPRIRTVKPEWLEDEQLLRAGSHARVLSIALILVADDYGRGRCIPEALAAQVFPFERDSSRVFRESLASLFAMGFVAVYRVREQQYFELRNWQKHQKVDKPGKPRVPAPKPSDYIELEVSRDSREIVSNDSRETRESLAPDRDQDQDQDLDREGDTRAPAIAVPLLRAVVLAGSPAAEPPHPGSKAHKGLPGRLHKTTPPERPAQALEAAGMVMRLWDIWRELTGVERATEPSRQQLDALGKLAVFVSEHADPEAHFEAVLGAWLTERRARGKLLELSFFASDFGVHAERASRAVSKSTSNGAVTQRADLEPFPPLPEIHSK